MVPVFWTEWLEMVRWQVNHGNHGNMLIMVTKRNVFLSDDNLADDEENIAEPKRKRMQKLLTVSPSSESDDSSTTELLNWIGLIISVKKDLLISFTKVRMKTEMFNARKK